MFGRIIQSHFPDPLGFGKSPTRFSDPRRRKPDNRFGVIYLGQSLKVCFIETILRDRRNGKISDFPIAETELAARSFVRVRVSSPLSLVDLRGDAPIRMGIPSDVAGASRQTLARQWSLAFHEHPDQPDGIIYPSRLNEGTNVAVYSRAAGKLSATSVRSLMTTAGLADVLNTLRVALV